MKFWLTSCIAICLIPMAAGQVVRGAISDLFTHQPIADAIVTVRNSAINAQTDQNGVFTLHGLEPGRYLLQVQHLQFIAAETDVLLESAKDAWTAIEMEPRIVPLEEVTVPGATAVQPLRTFRITQEETRLYPGTFFDPARFAASFPGVSVANDQANHLVINGLHPDLMQWRLEGLEIVNPNHLSNAGTIGDRSSASGGGVNMLSNLMLSNSSLVTGAFDQRFGNAISGVMDMHLRTGNPQQQEHTAQLGLLGIDFATEGPLKKGSASAFVLNGRYSTVGLLSEIGVDFGDEAIKFYDVSANVHIPLGVSGGTVQLFTILGHSSNDLSPKPIEEWVEDRDRMSIDYRLTTAIAGAQWTQPLGARSFLRIGSAISATEQDRTEIRADTSGTRQAAADAGNLGKWSTAVLYGTTLSDIVRLRAGVESVLTVRSMTGYAAFGAYTFNGDGNIFSVRPHIESHINISQRISTSIGLGVQFYTKSLENNELPSMNTIVLEPLLSVKYQPHYDRQWSLSYRRTSQSLTDLILIGRTVQQANLDLDPISADIFRMSYHHAFDNSTFEASWFWYQLNDVPISRNPYYSALNLNRLPNNLQLSNDGDGDTYGFTFAYRRNFDQGYFLNGNLSLIGTEHTVLHPVEQATSFDATYAIYLAGGKEWSGQKAYGKRTLGLNLAIIQSEGLKHGIIDEPASIAADRTIVDWVTVDNGQLDAYFRVDVRLYLRKDKSTHTSTWSLDIQNLLNRENAWLPSYDFFQNAVVPGKQLGIIPVINYRVDF